MSTAQKSILTINGGSSSIKFALFATDRSLHMKLKGQIDRIGMTDAIFSVQSADPSESINRPVVAKDHVAAVAALVDWIEANGKDDELIAMGHRVVHGGPRFHEPQRLTTELVDELRRLIPLAPQHLPKEILIMEAMQSRFPQIPHIVCFDTAFHHALPRVARLLPIPYRYEAQGVRRYGFHGLSYAFLMDELLRTEGAAVAGGRIILAHLGNGASLAAVRDGKPIDTSMGFTPAAGVPMSTRSGDIDPGLAGYLARTEGFDAKRFDDLVNFQSGLLGISETSADMRDLLLLEDKDPRAADAVALFCYQIKKWIGAFAAALGGVDALVFAGGIGENAPDVRARICAGLGFLGIELAHARNVANAYRISADTTAVKVRVIRTNEELVIARSVRLMLGLNAA
jgi:acetate kinase